MIDTQHPQHGSDQGQAPERSKIRERRLRDLIRRRHMGGRRMRPISFVPTLLTLGNLVCGFASIHYATKPVGPTQIFGWSTLTVAGLLLFLGMFFDAIDGSVARLTRSTSDLGAQLDSLADVVSFGVAPGFMMLRLVSHYYGPAGSVTLLGPDADVFYGKIPWTIAAVYVCCAALRLARFNVETPGASEEDHRTFKGLPSPGAAGAVASLIVLHQHLLAVREGVEENQTFARIAALGIPFITLLCAFAMVSTVRYVHFANRVLRARRDFPGIVRLVVPVIACIAWPQISLAVGFTFYAVSGPVRALWLRTRQQSAPPPAPHSP